VVIEAAELCYLKEAEALAKKGFVTGASGRNWNSYETSVTLPENTADWQRQLYCDPQTSGGLLIACAPEEADILLRTIIDAEYPAARIIGDVKDGQPRVLVEG
jgi:selenide,water dikinase